MKRLLTLLALLPALAQAAPYDLVIQQRNATDTGLAPNRFVAEPPGGANGVMGYNSVTHLPLHWTIGTGLSINAGALVALPQAWSSITGKPTTLAGYGITDAFPAPTGTTAQYLRGDGSLATLPAPGSGTVTSITAGTGLSGGTITTSGTVSLPNTGTAGTYSTVTTDAQGRVTAGTALSINDAPGRTLVSSTSATGFQVSATRVVEVCYEGSFSTTSTIGGPSSASVFLETADTNSTTPGDWAVKAQQTYTNTITLAVVLNQVQGNNWSFCRVIPAGKYVRIRAGSITGTASVTLNTTQQEVLR